MHFVEGNWLLASRRSQDSYLFHLLLPPEPLIHGIYEPLVDGDLGVQSQLLLQHPLYGRLDPGGTRPPAHLVLLPLAVDAPLQEPHLLLLGPQLGPEHGSFLVQGTRQHLCSVRWGV